MTSIQFTETKYMLTVAQAARIMSLSVHTVYRLIEQNKLFFSEEEFFYVCKPFIDEQYNSTNLNDLLQVLINNQIIEPVNDFLQFKMVYWISYFAANRMVVNSKFANTMLLKQNAIYNADLIDFYTGITGRNSVVVEKISEALASLNKSIEKVYPSSKILFKKLSGKI